MLSALTHSINPVFTHYCIVNTILVYSCKYAKYVAFMAHTQMSQSNLIGIYSANKRLLPCIVQ